MERKEEKPLLVSVIPLVPLPFGRSPIFSYLSSDELPSGTLVFVPFGPRTVRGVVWDARGDVQERKTTRRAIRYRPIKTILCVPCVSESTRRVAEYIANRYCTPLGRVLEDMLPKAVFSVSKKASVQEVSFASWQPLGFGVGSEMKLTTDQLRAAREILKKERRFAYLYGPAASGKTLVYQRVIRDRLKKSGQALVIVPDRLTALLETERYEGVFGKETIGIFHSDLPEAAFRRLRADVASGKKRIIIGTRQALFLPFRELLVLVLDDEESVSYKQFSVSPRYDARRVACELGKQAGAVVLFGSSAPSVSEYLHAEDSSVLVTLPERVVLPRLEMVNLRIERWKKRYQPLSRDLEDVIRETLLRKEQILLVVSRSGMSSFSVCTSCKEIFRCPNCGKPYRYEREGFFRCHVCGSKTDETPHCPACHSLEFRHIGVGTERVERDFERRFHGTKVVRWDANVPLRQDTISRLREFHKGARSVLITTVAGASTWSLPRLGLIAMIDADAGFGFPHWNADEEAFRGLVKIAGRAAHSRRGLVLLQTFHPENRQFEIIRSGSVERFFKDIQEERQVLLYPPYADLIRVRYEAATSRSLTKAVSLLEEDLKSLRERFSNSFRFHISPPYSSMHHKKHVWSQEVLLRIAHDDSQELNDAVHTLLLTLLPRWIVEVDPLR